MSDFNTDGTQAYKDYCRGLQKVSGLTGAALSEYIRNTVRRSYIILFKSETIRQRDMTPKQLQELAEHRRAMADAMNSID